MPKTARQGNAARQLIRMIESASKFRCPKGTEGRGNKLKRM